MTNDQVTAREALAEVTILDVWERLKSQLFGIGCWGLVIVVAALGEGITGADWSFPDLGIPSWVFWMLAIWLFFGLWANDTCIHKFRLDLFLPKPGIIGSFAWVAYGFGVYWLFSVAFQIEPKPLASFAALAIMTLLVLPPLVLLETLGLGYDRVMAARRAGEEREREERQQRAH